MPVGPSPRSSPDAGARPRRRRPGPRPIPGPHRRCATGSDRLAGGGPARPVEEPFDAQALQCGRVEVGADDRCRHLLPVGATAVERRSHPGESGEPPGPQDGRLGNLAALDRVPAQLLGIGDQVLRIEHEDRATVGPGARRVHVGVVPGGGHHRRSLVAQHRRDHEPLAFADPGHTDGQDVVLRLGEQPGAGGDVDPEGQRLALGRQRPSRRGRRCGDRRTCDPCAARRRHDWLSPDRRVVRPIPRSRRTNRTITTTSPTRTSWVTSSEAHIADGSGQRRAVGRTHARLRVAQMARTSRPKTTVPVPMPPDTGRWPPKANEASWPPTRMANPSTDDERQSPARSTMNGAIERGPDWFVASSIGRLVEEAEAARDPPRCIVCAAVAVESRGDVRHLDSPRSSTAMIGARGTITATPTATGPRRPHQAATGSAAPSTTVTAPGGTRDQGNGVDAHIGPGVGSVDHGAVADVDPDVVRIVLAAEEHQVAGDEVDSWRREARRATGRWPPEARPRRPVRRPRRPARSSRTRSGASSRRRHRACRSATRRRRRPPPGRPWHAGGSDPCCPAPCSWLRWPVPPRRSRPRRPGRPVRGCRSCRRPAPGGVWPRPERAQVPSGGSRRRRSDRTGWEVQHRRAGSALS